MATPTQTQPHLLRASVQNAYGSVAGSAGARAAAAGYYARRRVPTDPEQIVFAPGSKPLLWARVVDLEGRAPSGKAVVLRTAGRIIDVLPVFYLASWFVMNSGQGPRQRLGDRLAGTTVTGDRPLRAPR